MWQVAPPRSYTLLRLVDELSQIDRKESFFTFILSKQKKPSRGRRHQQAYFRSQSNLRSDLLFAITSTGERNTSSSFDSKEI
jgi:hypothetical protein